MCALWSSGEDEKLDDSTAYVHHDRENTLEEPLGSPTPASRRRLDDGTARVLYELAAGLEGLWHPPPTALNPGLQRRQGNAELKRGFGLGELAEIGQAQSLGLLGRQLRQEWRHAASQRHLRARLQGLGPRLHFRRKRTSSTASSAGPSRRSRAASRSTPRPGAASSSSSTATAGSPRPLACALSAVHASSGIRTWCEVSVTTKDKLLAALAAGSACDGCLGRRSAVEPVLAVNQTMRGLESTGVVVRIRSMCPNCGGAKLVNSTPTGVQVSPPAAMSVAPHSDAERPWFWEGHVQE